MGEEADQQEQTKAEVKPAEEKKEEKTEELKKKEDPKPPSPFVLFIDLHCVGCAKKIEKSILNNTGVEGVVIDMGENQVTIKGVVEPEAICNKIMKKTKRTAKVVSPLPAAEGEPIPQLVASQVSGLTTVELNVNMHCEACALQLKKKILKMKGVRTVETKLSSGRVTVSGTMDGNELVDYVYRRTKKQAKIVPQPEPEKPAAPVEEATKPTEAEKPAADEVPKPEEEAAEVEEKKDGGDESKSGTSEEKGGENQEEGRKEGGGGVRSSSIYDHEEQGMQRMMYYYQPLYVIERIPPPQLFSDENPNACSIS